MTRFTRTRFAAVALFAITGVLAPSPTADASPIDQFIDCSDSFWAIACAEAHPDDAELGPRIRIDNDAICSEIDGGLIYCHT